MEWVGWLALAVMICYCGYPGRVRALEKKVKKMEKAAKRENGESEMSKLIEELVGKKCTIETDIGGLTSDERITGMVVDVDDEWVRMDYEDKKSGAKTKIFRVENITQIEVIDE